MTRNRTAVLPKMQERVKHNATMASITMVMVLLTGAVISVVGDLVIIPKEVYHVNRKVVGRLMIFKMTLKLFMLVQVKVMMLTTV